MPGVYIITASNIYAGRLEWSALTNGPPYCPVILNCDYGHRERDRSENCSKNENASDSCTVKSKFCRVSDKRSALDSSGTCIASDIIVKVNVLIKT